MPKATITPADIAAATRAGSTPATPVTPVSSENEADHDGALQDTSATTETANTGGDTDAPDGALDGASDGAGGGPGRSGDGVTPGKDTPEAGLEDGSGDGSDTGDKAPAFEGEFDPQRAARLVANLRAEVAELKKAATEATTAATAAQRALYIEKARSTFGLDQAAAEFITATSEAEVNAQAEKLAKLAGRASAPTASTARSGSRLVPGHGGQVPQPFDASAVAAAARRR